jgi:tRNA nucleotidyltransferase (CCA-adding enzyme)
VAPGHKGFAVDFDPALTPRDAAARRDFTINALMFDPRRRELLDAFGGRADLERRILRHTSPAFAEDPLRVLRGMQFAARFQLTAASETLSLCRAMKSSHGELAVERIREEWFKWAAQSTRPSAGLRFLADTEWIEFSPELRALRGVPQDPEWHPEGDAFEHTCHCCDALVALPGWQQADEPSRIVFSLAVLTHDFGKAETTQQAERGGRLRIVSPGHEEASARLAETFLNRLRVPRTLVERILPLVRQHMAHLQTVTDRSVRRLAKRLEPETIRSLCLVMTADSLGRPPRPPQVPAVVGELEAKAAELQVQAHAPKPILLGRHLLELGLSPGPQIGGIVDAAYEDQLEGRFRDLAHAWAWLAERQDQFQLSPEARAALAAKHLAVGR